MGELESKYNVYKNGKIFHIEPFDEAVNSIKEHIRNVETRNEYLEKENKTIKDEKYKDAEMARMKEELETARKDLYRGFPISIEEWNSVKEWQQKHDEEKHGADYSKKKFRNSGAIGGSYKYTFVPTSIGTVGVCICSCGEDFTFQEL